MNLPRVYIIILNWNGAEDTCECLKSLEKLDYSNFEIVIMDNASIDNSVNVIKRYFPSIRIIKSPTNLGFTGGNNLAIKYALDQDAKYLWLLNNDTVAAPDSLARLVEMAKSSSHIGMVSPVIYYFDEPERVQYCGSYLDRERFSVIYPERKTIDVSARFTTGDDICLWGTALLIKQEVFERIGCLREDFFAYWEDTEFSIRTLNAGFKNIVCTTAAVYHKTPLPEDHSALHRPHRTYYMLRNSYLLNAEYLQGKKFRTFYRDFMAEVIVELGYAQRNNQPAVVDACLAAFRDAIRVRGGPMPPHVEYLPLWLKRVIAEICAWHPFLWAYLLRGDIRGMVASIGKVAGRKRLTNTT